MKKSLSIIQNGPQSQGESDGAQETPLEFRGRAAIVTLGCAKNQVDSEVMLGVLAQSGYEIVTDVLRADVVIVNTCGFLESSVRESIDAVLDISELKTSGQLRRLIVSGCMVERFRGDLSSELPEVDAFLTTQDLLSVGDAADGSFEQTLREAERPYFLYDDQMPRWLSTQGHFAYVKISEGCDRPCSFCIIPQLRGAMRSRSIDSVRREVEMLGQAGVREVNLIGQDLTAFGADKREPGLLALLEALDKDQAVDWVRLLYAYPLGIDAALLHGIEELPRICEYLDFPLQHSSEHVLKAMKRPLGKYSPRRMVEKIRNDAPAIHLRTTFIVGFPGESEKDFEDLLQFVSEGHFLNVGVFEYSQEQGASSAELLGQLPAELKQERRERLMLAQQEVLQSKLGEFIGQNVQVLIEGVHEETDLLFVGRSRFQAPEVDGIVIINELEVAADEVERGSMAQVEIHDVAGYDLIGTVISVQESDTAVEPTARPEQGRALNVGIGNLQSRKSQTRTGEVKRNHE